MVQSIARHVARLVVGAAICLGLVATGCYRPSYPECAITCASSDECPGDLTCSAGRCSAAPGGCAAGDVDAADDAGTAGAWAHLSVGVAHSCAIGGDRSLWCWGDNDRHQLGVASPARSGSPVQVDATGPLDWDRVEAGVYHTCGIRADGTLWCWGLDDDSQCGQAATMFVPPTRVADPPALGGTRWTDVALGAFYTCAIRDDGTLWCFGTSVAGQLGQGAMVDESAMPRRVGTRTDWRSVSARYYHTCAIHGAPQARGELECWGYDGSGEAHLGTGTPGDLAVPTPVMDEVGRDWRAVSAGEHASCALDDAGVLYCWGAEYYVPGQGGPTIPSLVDVGFTVDAVDLASYGGCLRAGGALSCYGFNEYGQLGSAPSQGSTVPVTIAGLGSVVEAGAGTSHACALDSAGTIRCWGDRGDGQLGDGVVADHRTPVEVVDDLGPWAQVDLGVDHTCAVTEAGAVYCWGLNTSGQLGGGDAMTAAIYDRPVLVDGAGYQRVAAGYHHTCAIGTDHHLACWGGNDHNQRGSGDAGIAYGPVPVAGATLGWLATGIDSSCGVDSGDASRVCWGDNAAHDLGNNDIATVPSPTTIESGPVAWSRVAMGVHYGCAIGGGIDDGILFCWGSNANGQTGDDPATITITAVPSQIPDPTPASSTDRWTEVATGQAHTCAIIAENPSLGGSLWCWGYDGYAQLGAAGPAQHTPQPVAAQSTADWLAVGAGANHTCGVRASGMLQCFGDGRSGQIGTGGAVEQDGLGGTVDGASDWVAVGVGNDSSCGIRGADRRLYCWGDNRYGQLGTGESLSFTPVVVPKP